MTEKEKSELYKLCSDAAQVWLADLATELESEAARLREDHPDWSSIYRENALKVRAVLCKLFEKHNQLD